MRTDLIFTTVCIGDPSLDNERVQNKGYNHYFSVANILIHSVLKYSSAKIVIVTDMPDSFEKNERVVVHDIRQLTDEPLVVQGYFNYHLKRIAIKKAFEEQHNYVIYMDCDMFLTQPIDDKMLDEWDAADFEVAGRLGGDGTIQDLLNTNVIEASTKIKEFGPAWDDAYVNATLPHETFFLFRKNKEKQNIFLNTWDEIAKHSLKFERRIYADAYYFGCSIFKAGMKKMDFATSNTQTTANFYHSLNIIHENKINTIYITEIEPYDYNTLLNRMK